MRILSRFRKRRHVYLWQDLLFGRLRDPLAKVRMATWSLIQECLARWTAADLDRTFQRRDGLVSRQWIIWHVIEHDLHRGGELFLTCSMHGLPVPEL